MDDKQQKIISDEGFIDSIRDLGLTTTDAVNEFIDNSFDVNANSVWITIKKEKGKIIMIVEDDGEGIPPNEIKKALAFGGRISTRRISTGKFGWGLSSAACCQSSKTELYSKIKGGDYLYNYIDLEELKKSAGYLPNTIKKSPLSQYKKLNLDESFESGTILILKHLDRPDRKRIDILKNLLKENLAIVQRKFLFSGRHIYINSDPIKYHDPLMLMDGFDGVEECGKGKNYGEIEPLIFDDIKDDGNPAKIEILVSKLPVNVITEKKLQRKSPFNISTDTQGFYIMRHGRQIAGGQTLRLFTKHPQLNYFRAEISFPPALDKKFGIQTNKSRFSLDDDLREQLRGRLEKMISQIRMDIESEQDNLRAEQMKVSDIEESISEKIAGKARKKLKPSGYKITKEEEEEVKKRLEKEKNKKIKRIKEAPEIAEDRKEEMIRQIEIAFQKERTFQKVIDIIGTGEFYQMKHKGKIIEVIINQGHKFYTKIYERATQDPKMQILLDLFLFTLVLAEDIYFDNEEVRSFYNTQRREWSAIMSTFLEEAEKVLEEE